ncbi:alpha/beta hydrolase [Mucilaginibacter achroorhodeus]|uniref:Alpha/beta hydrolase n=1 Tax=Mucilaginibacter achroorhodeus TaxID=2599294 RepID=A0A563U432_9SPHI|nr:alpha/beta hydrolase [Mucilaginibacter achroorhodeus]TWR26107.1 alpha/beta hydrolase [Mucilaginibacter achroorhodeus]
MPKVFLIAGLGADSRIFTHILLPNNYEKIGIQPLNPRRADTLNDVAQHIINQYNITVDDVVIGDSLGGIIAVEIGKLMPIRKLILTSTIKTSSEEPWYFKILRKLPVYDITPARLFTKLGAFVKPMLRHLSDEDALLIKSMLADSSPSFLKWGAQAALHWRNDVIPPNLHHIIGDKDLVFPCKNIKNPTAVIKGGTHIMVFDRANEINTLLADILKA